MNDYSRARLTISHGDQFGRWTVLYELAMAARRSRQRRFMCRCDCGREKPIHLGNLRSGRSTQCRSCAPRKPIGTHATAHPLYRMWASMHERCRNHRLYGGRGIQVCKRWGSFTVFVADMGPRPSGHSIDRINPFGNYEPSNCRWADRKTQANNKRIDKRHVVNGARMSLQEIGRLAGVSGEAIRLRILAGMAPEDAARTPRRPSWP